MTDLKYRALVLDVDSTVSGIEGIDWLAARRGPDVAQRVLELTRRAMDGVSRMIAAVPAKESWKPTSHASSGRHASIAAAVTAREVHTCDGLPSRVAAIARAPIADARTAAGEAPPASAYRPISPIAGHVEWRPRRGRSAACAIRAKTATFSPLSTSR